MSKFIKFPLLLALVALVCGGALSIVYEIANPIIVERAKAETKAALSEVVTGLKTYNQIEGEEGDALTTDMATYGIEAAYELVNDSDDVMGYAFSVKSNGKNEISSLVYLSKDGQTVKGFKVLSNQETAGIGDKAINSEDYMAKFVGISASSVDSIDNYSGATLTSGGLKEAISNAAGFYSSASFQAYVKK